MMRQALALATALALFGTTALAQSVGEAPGVGERSSWGCNDLGGTQRLASVEGAGGTFFRLDPDLLLIHPFADETVALMATLSKALAARGTTLVYVPLPPRSLAMPEALPPEARDLGFDAVLAATLYDEVLQRLAERGVIAVNARTALRSAPGTAASFFATDPRLTATGASRLAKAIAATLAGVPDLSDLPRAGFETRATGTQRLQSAMRTVLQRHCLATLPEVEAETFVTTRLGMSGASGASGLVGAGLQTRIALLGTEVAGDPALNLAGFLSADSGLEVQQYSVAGGGAFAAISSYMTSRAFADQRPAVLVWAVPVHDGLAINGDQPLRELIAAADDDCRIVLPTGQGAAPDTLIADLAGVEASAMLFVDTGGGNATELRADFTGPDGQVRSRWVRRHPGQIASGRFYLPLDGLWPGGARRVEFRIDAAFGLDARAAACPQQTPGAP